MFEIATKVVDERVLNSITFQALFLKLEPFLNQIGFSYDHSGFLFGSTRGIDLTSLNTHFPVCTLTSQSPKEISVCRKMQPTTTTEGLEKAYVITFAQQILKPTYFRRDFALEHSLEYRTGK